MSRSLLYVELTISWYIIRELGIKTILGSNETCRLNTGLGSVRNCKMSSNLQQFSLNSTLPNHLDIMQGNAIYLRRWNVPIVHLLSIDKLVGHANHAQTQIHTRYPQITLHTSLMNCFWVLTMPLVLHKVICLSCLHSWFRYWVIKFGRKLCTQHCAVLYGRSNGTHLEANDDLLLSGFMIIPALCPFFGDSEYGCFG